MLSKRHTAYLCVVWVCTLGLFGLLTREFLFFRQRDSSILSFLAMLLLIFASSLTLMLLNYRRARRLREAAHLEELTRMKRELAKTARRYKSLLEGAGNAIFVFNPETGLLVEVNRKGCELLGYGRDEMKTLRGKDLIPEEDHEKFTSLVLRVIRRGRGRSDGLTFQRKAGERLMGEVEARLIDLGDEKVVHATVRDVTQRHRAEKELRQRNRELSILNGIIAMANQEMKLETVLYVTLRETIEAFGAEGGGIHLQEEDGPLKPAATFAVAEYASEAFTDDGSVDGPLGRIAATRRPFALERLSEADSDSCRQVAAKGWNGFAGVPLFANNRVIGVMYLLTREPRRYSDDEMKLFLSIATQIGITIEHARLFNELKWKSEELMRSVRLLEKSSRELAVSQHRLRDNLTVVEQANKELERIDRIKSSFLGMISHEFRTPLTSIISGTDFLLSSSPDDVNGDTRRVLEMIHQGGKRLAEIVNDILKMARLEANNYPVAKSPLHFTDVFDRVLVNLEPLLKVRDLKIIFNNLEMTPYFNGNLDCLEEVFTELLENSIKFTPDGGSVVIAARIADRTSLEAKQETLARFHEAFYDQMGERCYLEVEVRDSGIGVSFDEQVKIFDKFYEVGEIRHHSSGKHKFQGKGAGLGLAIVKGMVEAHGGMVWVESPEPGSPTFGSAFFVLLPLEECPLQGTLPFSPPGTHAGHDEGGNGQGT